jgi:hypothetical protein
LSKDEEKGEEIVIAAFRDDHWLVVGEAHLSDLLDPGVEISFSVSFIECESWAQVLELWQNDRSEEEAMRMPWSIHPAIARRLRRDALLEDDDEAWNLNLK